MWEICTWSATCVDENEKIMRKFWEIIVEILTGEVVF